MNGYVDEYGLFRPKVSVWKGVSVTLLIIIIHILFIGYVHKLFSQTSFFTEANAILSIIILTEIVLGLRYYLIWFIRLYQSSAPPHIRLTCRYEPSCSEYSIMSLRKYGVIVGLLMTIERLSRCGNAEGGSDYPDLMNLSNFFHSLKLCLRGGV